MLDHESAGLDDHRQHRKRQPSGERDRQPPARQQDDVRDRAGIDHLRHALALVPGADIESEEDDACNQDPKRRDAEPRECEPWRRRLAKHGAGHGPAVVEDQADAKGQRGEHPGPHHSACDAQFRHHHGDGLAEGPGSHADLLLVPRQRHCGMAPVYQSDRLRPRPASGWRSLDPDLRCGELEPVRVVADPGTCLFCKPESSIKGAISPVECRHALNGSSNVPT